jgi:hypothetical protein
VRGLTGVSANEFVGLVANETVTTDFSRRYLMTFYLQTTSVHTRGSNSFNERLCKRKKRRVELGALGAVSPAFPRVHFVHVNSGLRRELVSAGQIALLPAVLHDRPCPRRRAILATARRCRRHWRSAASPVKTKKIKLAIKTITAHNYCTA